MQKDLKDLLIDELHDLLSSEEQIVEALPKMAQASESPDLKEAFEMHLKETKGQVQRLEKIFKIMKVEKKEKFCKGTRGLIQEGKEVLKDYKTKSSIRDAALISKAQRIEHYEISAYGTAHAFAKELDLGEIADLLKETLEEEASADKKLSKIAEGGFFRSGINLQAIAPNEKKGKSIKPKASSKPKVESSQLKAKQSQPKANNSQLKSKAKTSQSSVASSKSSNSKPKGKATNQKNNIQIKTKSINSKNKKLMPKK